MYIKNSKTIKLRVIVLEQLMRIREGKVKKSYIKETVNVVHYRNVYVDQKSVY